MRRSQAPSVLRAAKRGHQEEEAEPLADWPAVTPTMEWGRPLGYKSSEPRELKPGENPLKDSRIFHVLWRNQTNKKHKIWTGNGTLVITESQATLKDDTGKVVASMTCFRKREYKENDQLEIGSKDVELQDEFKTVEECAAYRKLEIANWDAKINALNGHVATPTPHIDAKATDSPPSTFDQVETHTEVSRPIRTTLLKRSNAPGATCTRIEYMCFLRPAELQVKALKFLSELSQRSDMETSPSIIAEMAKHICDHPVQLKARALELPHCKAMQLLMAQLPSWDEMGPNDSAKFEFVHMMLDDLDVAGGDKCCVLANNQHCLQLIKGYCEFYDIPHMQLNNASDVASFNTAHQAATVAVVLASERTSEMRSLRCKYFILYNYDERWEAERLLAGNQMDTKVYTLITSGGCPEELEFYKSLELMPGRDNLYAAAFVNVLRGKAKQALASWSNVEPPYSQEFLEDASISVSLESLSNIFIKKKSIKK